MTEQHAQAALVTGAATGIGRRIAEVLMADGFHVHICDVSAPDIEAFLAANPSATATVADVSATADVDRVFADLAATGVPLGVLVNNAGIAGPTGPVETLDTAAWDQCLAVNVSGAFYMARRAVPLLREADTAAIINIASNAGLHGFPLRSPYAAGKWAMIGLTRTWAMELGPAGIRVNAICPGSVSGPRIDGVIERDAAARDVPADQVRDVYLRQSSMRLFASPDDVANMAAFLASSKAASISGQAIGVDGHTEGLSNWLDT